LPIDNPEQVSDDEEYYYQVKNPERKSKLLSFGNNLYQRNNQEVLPILMMNMSINANHQSEVDKQESFVRGVLLPLEEEKESYSSQSSYVRFEHNL
jgi:hypothetical protein